MYIYYFCFRLDSNIGGWGEVSSLLDHPLTGKSIALAFALRACVRSCVSAMTISVARADPMGFVGGPAVRPAVRLSGQSPVQLSCLAS